MFIARNPKCVCSVGDCRNVDWIALTNFVTWCRMTRGRLCLTTCKGWCTHVFRNRAERHGGRYVRRNPNRKPAKRYSGTGLRRVPPYHTGSQQHQIFTSSVITEFNTAHPNLFHVKTQTELNVELHNVSSSSTWTLNLFLCLSRMPQGMWNYTLTESHLGTTWK